jgi:4-carboxymuconolactone decarboxylase
MTKDRMPPIPAELWTAEQKEAAAKFERERGGLPFGPFVPLLRSPEAMVRAMAMGDYLRFKSALPHKLNELVILVTARAWTQQFEWHYHRREAIEAGLAKEIADAIAEGRHPERMDEDESAVFNFASELQRSRSVSDATYARVVKRFGEKGAIDIAAVSGYYTLLAMVMNVARTPVPDDSQPPLPPLPN